MKGVENQIGVLTDRPACFQGKAEILVLFNNSDYLQTGELFPIWKSEEEYRKGEKKKNLNTEKWQRGSF